MPLFYCSFTPLLPIAFKMQNLLWDCNAQPKGLEKRLRVINVYEWIGLKAIYLTNWHRYVTNQFFIHLVNSSVVLSKSQIHHSTFYKINPMWYITYFIDLFIMWLTEDAMGHRSAKPQQSVSAESVASSWWRQRSETIRPASLARFGTKLPRRTFEFLYEDGF